MIVSQMSNNKSFDELALLLQKSIHTFQSIVFHEGSLNFYQLGTVHMLKDYFEHNYLEQC